MRAFGHEVLRYSGSLSPQLSLAAPWKSFPSVCPGPSARPPQRANNQRHRGGGSAKFTHSHPPTALARRFGGTPSEIVARRVIGERRWNLKMKSGLGSLAPENDPLSAMATLVSLPAPVAASSDRDVLTWTCARRQDFSRDSPRRPRPPPTTEEKPVSPEASNSPPLLRQFFSLRARPAVLSVLDVGASKVAASSPG